VNLDDGTVVSAAEPETTVVLVTCADGTWATRSTPLNRDTTIASVVRRADDVVVDEVPVGPYDIFNHFLAVRDAPSLLMLEGQGDRPHQDKWMIELRPGERPPTRRLYPLEWDRVRDAHLFGGPAAFVEDAVGPALIHAGTVHDGRGLLPGNSFVVRRSFPEGMFVWQVTTDGQATALDERDGIVLVTYNTGWLLLLSAMDGVELARTKLSLRGHDVVPLSASLGPDGDVVIGTLDGRIVRASMSLPTG
jgi:hypothetical protein